jgi:hypothetical protein
LLHVSAGCAIMAAMRKLWLLISLWAAPAGAESLLLPAWATTAERLTYRVTWWGMEAGHAELFHQPGNGGYTLVARAWTTDGAANLFSMRDRLRAEGTHRPALFLPTRFSVRLNENDYRADKTLTYDRAARKATYRNHREPPATAKDFDIDTQTRDLYSALYSLRASAKEPKPEAVYTLPVQDLDRPMTLHLKVLERVRLDTVLGQVETLHVQPVLDGKKEGRQKDRVHIWVTDDDRRLPVKIQVRLALGSFTATLQAVGDGASPSEAPAELPLDGDITLEPRKRPHADPAP